jgi:hypothetical protein
MISEVKTKKGAKAITSDRWHLVHSRFTGVQQGPPFSRDVLSEHEDRAACVKAAKKLRAKLALENAEAPAAEQDEVFVRKPNFRSLKRAQRRSPVAE